MMNIVMWVVISTTLLAFCLKKIYLMGYYKGAGRVLDEWKKTVDEMGTGDE
jgi:hypothetical protein